ncbi:cytochrome c biogenesis protein ResB [Prochlorococcus sp. MIT 1300]|uniref:cytochrome c biogenesis protein ResB n=1 Tax=Prochlorococcus sp. MIT 1300 TaxID=3096218 RepID=UPI002A766347|nr:cytochrome c biogenesis protein ResB [Prochlorococcus sp. MIT 1300]
MAFFKRLLSWISDLRVAIALLLVIALSSALGTAIPQGEPSANYIDIYQENPWLGIFDGQMILRLELDHVYTSNWFLALLAWLGIALMICSWRRQWPTLQAALRWIDYKEPRQISKLAIAETLPTTQNQVLLKKLTKLLKESGWDVQNHEGRLAARKGVIGRIGPPLVHIGLVLLMIGAVWGAFGGQRVERFLAPGRSLELMNKEGVSQLTLSLTDFNIERDPKGRPEQFRSKIELLETTKAKKSIKEVSVNHPLRFKGITVYQADWSLAAITLQIGRSPKLQLPLNKLPELGENVWGLVLPTRTDGSEPVVISLTNEAGPIQVFNPKGELLANLRPGGEPAEINGIPLKVIQILPASGLLLKRDPGVPIVYLAFAITLTGGALSMVATRQLWAICDQENSSLHVGGLCNRNLSGLAEELPILLSTINGN